MWGFGGSRQTSPIWLAADNVQRNNNHDYAVRPSFIIYCSVLYSGLQLITGMAPFKSIRFTTTFLDSAQYTYNCSLDRRFDCFFNRNPNRETNAILVLTRICGENAEVRLYIISLKFISCLPSLKATEIILIRRLHKVMFPKAKPEKESTFKFECFTWYAITSRRFETVAAQLPPYDDILLSNYRAFRLCSFRHQPIPRSSSEYVHQ